MLQSNAAQGKQAHRTHLARRQHTTVAAAAATGLDGFGYRGRYDDARSCSNSRSRRSTAKISKSLRLSVFLNSISACSASSETIESHVGDVGSLLTRPTYALTKISDMKVIARKKTPIDHLLLSRRFVPRPPKTDAQNAISGNKSHCSDRFECSSRGYARIPIRNLFL
jgi:hypothetical protein